jgi:hypothetical protein
VLVERPVGKRIAGVCTAIAGAALVASAWAQAPSGSDLKAGIRAYDTGDLHRAAPILRAATRGLAAPRERAKAWLYLGLTLAALKDAAPARQAFAAALMDDPEIAPDSDRVAPAILGEFAAVRRLVVGELRVEAGEPRARVYVGDEERGRTPLTLRLPVGRYAVRVLSEDTYRIYEQRAVVVSARAPVRILAQLAQRLGHLKLRVVPGGANVYLRERLIATTPAKPVRLPAGRHRLAVRLPGYEEATQEVLVEPEKTVELRFALRRVPPPWYVRRRTWGWISVGLSAASLGAGLLVGKSARSSEEALRSGEREGTITHSRFNQLASSAESNARIANVFFSVAGAAAVAGLVLLFVGDPAEEPRRAWKLLPAAGGASLAVRF